MQRTSLPFVQSVLWEFTNLRAVNSVHLRVKCVSSDSLDSYELFISISRAFLRILGCFHCNENLNGYVFIS